MVIIAQLVRASDCGSEGRGFESHWSPQGSLVLSLLHVLAAFYLISFVYNVFEVAKTLVLATFFLVWGGEGRSLCLAPQCSTAQSGICRGQEDFYYLCTVLLSHRLMRGSGV